MAATPKPAGVVGGRVAANLRQLRKGMSTYELSRRLKEEIGWPIRASAITLIEAGRRRTDVDDLCALAAALNASPNRLMFPAMEQRPGVHYGLPVVGNVTAIDTDIWAWATGERPLVQLKDGEREKEPPGSEVAAFMLANQPHHYADALERLEGKDIVDALADAMTAAVRRGTSAERLREILNDAIDRAAHGES